MVDAAFPVPIAIDPQRATVGDEGLAGSRDSTLRCLLTELLGVIFFAWKRIPHHHAIWHVFVMIGSVCHFVTVMYFVIPTGK